MHQANKIRNTLIRIWGILSLVVVMGYSVLGWHHHVGVHVCLAYEHLFLDGLCIYDVCDRGHLIPSGQTQPVPFETHHQGHNGHSCKCSVEYFSAINGEQTAKVIRQIRQLSPIWVLLAFLLYSIFLPQIPQAFLKCSRTQQPDTKGIESSS